MRFGDIPIAGAPRTSHTGYGHLDNHLPDSLAAVTLRQRADLNVVPDMSRRPNHDPWEL
jgi:hypothetical protein